MKMFVKALILCIIAGVALAENSPVFLWGVNSPAKPSLQTVTQSEFSTIIEPLLKNHMVVVFQENGLSANDFLCANAETSQSCYAQLQGVAQKTYYAGVENPTEALRNVAVQREFNTVGKNGQLETPLECAAGKVVFVNFEDEQVARGATLESHDAAISAITKELSCPTVNLYLATPSTVVPKRIRRETAAPQGGYIFRDSTWFLLFYTQISYFDGTNTEVLETASTALKNNSATEFSVTVTFKNSKELNFDITLNNSYYMMSGVSYDTIGDYVSTDVNAPTNFSFYCGNLTLSSAASSVSLTFNSLQLQAPFGATTDPNFAFGDAWHCVGFFTPGILAGLFVVFILLFIIFIGVCWMVDINTMDRFDDPKGKTITINAAE